MKIRMMQGENGAADEAGTRSTFYEEGRILEVGKDIPHQVAMAFLDCKSARLFDEEKGLKGPESNKALKGPPKNK